MSYDISLLDPSSGEAIEFDEPHDLAGGTFALGGTTRAWLNITWNYGPHFRRTLGEKGIRRIYGLTAAQSLPLLRQAIDQLGDDRTDNYWEGTEGNAKAALLNLVALAERAPHGVWDGD